MHPMRVTVWCWFETRNHMFLLLLERNWSCHITANGDRYKFDYEKLLVVLTGQCKHQRYLISTGYDDLTRLQCELATEFVWFNASGLFPLGLSKFIDIKIVIQKILPQLCDTIFKNLSPQIRATKQNRGGSKIKRSYFPYIIAIQYSYK